MKRKTPMKVAAPLTADQYLAQLSTLTGMSVQDWTDFLSCTPDEQMLIVQGYKDQNWVKARSTFADVLTILGILGTIAGIISGVAGAASAVAALKSL